MDSHKILTASIELLAKRWAAAEEVFRTIGLHAKAEDVLKDGTRWGWAKKGKDWSFVWYDVNGGALPISDAPLHVRIEAASRLDVLVALCEAAQTRLVQNIEDAVRRLDDWKKANEE
jgi:hypothetical protein